MISMDIRYPQPHMVPIYCTVSVTYWIQNETSHPLSPTYREQLSTQTLLCCSNTAIHSTPHHQWEAWRVCNSSIEQREIKVNAKPRTAYTMTILPHTFLLDRCDCWTARTEIKIVCSTNFQIVAFYQAVSFHLTSHRYSSHVLHCISCRRWYVRHSESNNNNNKRTKE